MIYPSQDFQKTCQEILNENKSFIFTISDMEVLAFIEKYNGFFNNRTERIMSFKLKLYGYRAYPDLFDIRV